MPKFSSAENYLAKIDPALGAIIESNGPLETIKPWTTDYFEALCESIISQQISIKAADKIFGRFRLATDLLPERVLLIDEDSKKEIGLSAQKLRYLKSLAQHFADDPAVFKHLDGLSDEAVIRELTNVKGIGEWTAQMFLMFVLCREDIFAPNDGGLQRAMVGIYQLDRIRPKELAELAAKWAPHRSTASRHLWKTLDK